MALFHRRARDLSLVSWPIFIPQFTSQKKIIWSLSFYVFVGVCCAPIGCGVSYITTLAALQNYFNGCKELQNILLSWDDFQ